MFTTNIQTTYQRAEQCALDKEMRAYRMAVRQAQKDTNKPLCPGAPRKKTPFRLDRGQLEEINYNAPKRGKIRRSLFNVEQDSLVFGDVVKDLLASFEEALKEDGTMGDSADLGVVPSLELRAWLGAEFVTV